MTREYYQDEWVRQYSGNCLDVLPDIPSESVDLLATDPPYGISFMAKDWDKALPDIAIWKECLRVLKPGAFAFVMCIPRADCLSRMIISLEDAGFRVNFTPIYWTYASGFPKAQNIGKKVDKRLGVEREVVGYDKQGKKSEGVMAGHHGWAEGEVPITKGKSTLEGSYGGFQPKPAVEVIIVCMKPLSEKTFVDQALKNRKGITWLDDCRIPIDKEADKSQIRTMNRGVRPPNDGWGLNENESDKPQVVSPSGRFPANLLVSDDVLNDGQITKSGKDAVRRQEGMFVEHHLGGVSSLQIYHPDSGSFSRYFDLDKWAQKTFPFLIVPKTSKSEKNKGLDYEPQRIVGRDRGQDIRNVPQKARSTPRINQHPTVKPFKLMSYLITLGSREGDTVLDPFMGSGTTALASKLLNRKCIGIEIEEKYCEIVANRCRQMVMKLT